MFIVGLTGGIGSGKSTVARMFENHGIVTVDADDIAREVVEPGEPALERIRQHFGGDILQDDGSLNRAQLRQRIFSDDDERLWLEQLLHPVIGERLAERLHSADSPYAMLVSPLLLETSQHQLCDRILVVDVPEETQIRRTMERDDNPEDQVRRIIQAQMPRNKRLEGAHDVIDNDREYEVVQADVARLHQHYLSNC